MTQGFTGINKGMSIPLAVKEGGTGLTSTTINQILYSPSTNTISGLATANTGIYIVTPTPSISTGGQIPGTNTNDNASLGNVGEFLSNTILYANRVSATLGAVYPLMSLTLTPGDWNVYGSGLIEPSSAGSPVLECWVSKSNSTFPDLSMRNIFSYTPAVPFGRVNLPVPVLRISINSQTPIYLCFYIAGGAFSANVCGSIQARRVR